MAKTTNERNMFQINLEELQSKLLALTAMRQEVLAAIENPTSRSRTFFDLERAVANVERLVRPFFYVDYIEDEHVYCLITETETT